MTSGTRVGRWAKHQSALAALTESLRALEACGIPAVVVKGMVLAYSLYSDVADRPLSDVDLRIRPLDFLRAARALGGCGVRLKGASRQLGSASFVVCRELVEIETTVGPPGLCALRVSRLLERSQGRTLPGGLRVREPEVHDHAIVLLVNAYKDKMVGCPPWSIDDLDVIAERVDANTLLERVREARIRTLAWIAADWMAQERRSEPWRRLRDRMGARPPRPHYARVMRYLFARNHDSIGSRVLARMASDSRRQRLWAIAAGGAGAGASWIEQRV